MKRTISEDALIKKASTIGTHTLDCDREYMTMTDTGRLFVDASIRRVTYGKNYDKYPSDFLRAVVL